MKKVIFILLASILLCGCSMVPAPVAVQEAMEAEVYAMQSYFMKYPPEKGDAEYMELSEEMIVTMESLLRWAKGAK